MRAENQIAARQATTMPIMLTAISHAGTAMRLMRMGIMIGAANGSIDITEASVLCGASATGWMKIALTISSIATGVAACCASDSLFTVLPTAAYRHE